MDLLDFGSVQIGGRQERNPARRVDAGDKIEVHLPWHGVRRFYEISPERVVYRDAHLLAYDKEAGVPSQQTPSDAYNNVFAAIQRFLKGETADSYAALHHRLDRETSGVMLFAVHRDANRALGAMFQERRVKKEYLVWVEGSPEWEEFTAIDDIGRKGSRYVSCARGLGKKAETRFAVLRREEGRSFLRAKPLTGRTHQIRLHLAACGHPVLGDIRYGGKAAERLYLHAHRLIFPHPSTGKELVLTAPLPSDWPSVLMVPIGGCSLT